MRKLIFAINTTLDGCVDHDKQTADEETHQYFTELLRGVDLQVFGRKTYELMVPFWPEVARSQSMDPASNEFARVFDSIDKLVFSRTLTNVEDPRTKIARSGLREEVLKMKSEPGKGIVVGGVDVATQLIELRLVDEYRFVVGPSVVGAGRRLFETVNSPLQLRLVDSRFFKSGSVALRYVNG